MTDISDICVCCANMNLDNTDDTDDTDHESLITLSDSLLYYIIETYLSTADLLKLRMTNKYFYNKTNDNNLYKFMYLNLRSNSYLIDEDSKIIPGSCNSENCFRIWYFQFYQSYTYSGLSNHSNIFTRDYLIKQKTILDSIKKENVINGLYINEGGLPKSVYHGYHGYYNGYDNTNRRNVLYNIWKQIGCPCSNKMHYNVETLSYGNNKSIVNYKNYHFELAKRHKSIYKDNIKINNNTINNLKYNINKKKNKYNINLESELLQKLESQNIYFNNNIKCIEHLIELNKKKNYNLIKIYKK